MFYPCISLPGSAHRVVNTLDGVTGILDALIKFFYRMPYSRGVRNLLPMQRMQETWVQSLDWEDPLE